MFSEIKPTEETCPDTGQRDEVIVFVFIFIMHLTFFLLKIKCSCKSMNLEMTK